MTSLPDDAKGTNVTSEPNYTSAPFRPSNRKYFARFNALEIMGILVGVAACSTGLIGTLIGVTIIIGTLYSVVFIPPKFNRGLYIGNCPHCGAEMSATHYHSRVDCPGCGGFVAVRENKFVALGKNADH